MMYRHFFLFLKKTLKFSNVLTRLDDYWLHLQHSPRRHSSYISIRWCKALGRLLQAQTAIVYNLLKIYFTFQNLRSYLAIDIAGKTYMMTSSSGNIFSVTGLCEENSRVTIEFPSQRTVTRNFYIFFDLCLNKRLCKHSWGLLWRHCNVAVLEEAISTSVTQSRYELITFFSVSTIIDNIFFFHFSSKMEFIPLWQRSFISFW